MKIYHKHFIPPVGTAGIDRFSGLKNDQLRNKMNFSEHLNRMIGEQESLTISKHAKQRLEQRNIRISTENWEKINEKISEAKRKGVNESLVLLDNAALIISAKNKTVITAMNRNEAESKIFTNINGTIILSK